MLNTITRAIRELFAHETTLYNELSRKSINKRQGPLDDESPCLIELVANTRRQREAWCLF